MDNKIKVSNELSLNKAYNKGWNSYGWNVKNEDKNNPYPIDSEEFLAFEDGKFNKWEWEYYDNPDRR